jgi:tRNA(Ile)-lysidine synthase
MNEYKIYRKVQSYIKEYQMLREGDWILIGLSGGADSMALAHLLVRMSRERQLHLLAVHVNHGIRGAEALRDQRTVEEFCTQQGIPCRVFCYDVPEVARKRRIGEEEAGRLCREQAFEEAASSLLEDAQKEATAIHIALAHNQNDLAETMLHHLARGSGLKGLTGILPVNGAKIRPVLCLTREEIEVYCRECRIAFVTDSTNLQDDYTRNRIRHRVLPALVEEVNLETIPHMAQSARQILEAEDYISRHASDLLMRQQHLEDGYLLGPSFFGEPPIIKKYALMQALKELSGTQKDFAAVHIRDVLGLFDRQVSKKVMLPCQLEACRMYGGVAITRRKKELFQTCKEDCPDQKQWELLPGEPLSCPLGEFSTNIFSYHGEKIEEKKYTKWFDYDKIINSMVVRTRRSGDFLVIDQEGRHKTLGRCFIDGKIPSAERDTIPLLACGSEVLWIVGGRINERYKIQADTRNVFQVRYQRGETYAGEN